MSAGAALPEQTYYRWKKQYGGIRIDQAKRLKDLEKENSRLKRLLADAELDSGVSGGRPGMTEEKRSRLLSPAKQQRAVELFYPSHDLGPNESAKRTFFGVGIARGSLGSVSLDPLTHR